MTQIQLKTAIKGSKKEVFDLSRNIDFHVDSAVSSNEKAIEGVTTGLINLGESVRWRGKHFGLFLAHTSKIVEMHKYDSFTDVMTHGHFKYFVHQHLFEQCENQVLMTDILKYRVPFGPLGWLLDRLFIKQHLHKFLLKRNAQIKQSIENLVS